MLPWLLLPRGLPTLLRLIMMYLLFRLPYVRLVIDLVICGFKGMNCISTLDLDLVVYGILCYILSCIWMIRLNLNIWFNGSH